MMATSLKNRGLINLQGCLYTAQHFVHLKNFTEKTSFSSSVLIGEFYNSVSINSFAFRGPSELRILSLSVLCTSLGKTVNTKCRLQTAETRINGENYFSITRNSLIKMQSRRSIRWFKKYISSNGARSFPGNASFRGIRHWKITAKNSFKWLGKNSVVPLRTSFNRWQSIQ